MNRIKGLIALTAGAVLTCATGAAQTSTNLISETTFDTAAPVPWSFGYFYGNDGYGFYSVVQSYYFPDDAEYTNAVFQFTFDTTDLAGMTGWGTGAGAPLFRADSDPALFVSGDRADYILTFDARAEGLLEGQTAANAEWQAQFYRKDESSQDVNMLQVNLGFQPTSEWQTFTFKLDQGSLGANTTEADFAQYHGETTDIRFNVNMHEPFNAFGNDGDNALYIDNVKLEVVDHPPVVLTPTYATTLLDWNMDDKPLWSEYHYDWSQNDVHATFTAGNNSNGTDPNAEGVDGSSAWILSMDNSIFNDGVVPSWAGGGSGGNGPVDYAGFDTADLSKYQIVFDARAAGLAEGRENTTIALQIFLDAPDDTVQPADENADPDFLVRLDTPVRVSGNFQTLTFNLGKAAIGDGSKANFEAYFNRISELRTQWQIENATSLADWGYDADNALVVDNIRLERLHDGLPPLSFVQEGNELVLTWENASSGMVHLQAAETVDGAFEDLETTGTSYRAATDGTQRYFRLSWTPPTQ